MKKIMMIVLAAITAAAMFAGCASDNDSAGGSVSTDGSTSMEKVIGALGESFMANNQGTTFTYNPTGSGSGIKAVLEGRCDIGLSSRSLKDDEKAEGLKETVLAYDGIAIIVNPELLHEMQEAALEVKKKVYDNRIVFFAPLYLSNLCVNSCKYCGFRVENKDEVRHVLTMDEVRDEVAAVIDEGHKRMIAVYGEHPKNGADYIADSISTIYSVKRTTPTGNGFNNIRRVNVNAAPMEIADMKKLWRCRGWALPHRRGRAG